GHDLCADRAPDHPRARALAERRTAHRQGDRSLLPRNHRDLRSLLRDLVLRGDAHHLRRGRALRLRVRTDDGGRARPLDTARLATVAARGPARPPGILVPAARLRSTNCKREMTTSARYTWPATQPMRRSAPGPTFFA